MEKITQESEDLIYKLKLYRKQNFLSMRDIAKLSGICLRTINDILQPCYCKEIRTVTKRKIKILLEKKITKFDVNKIK